MVARQTEIMQKQMEYLKNHAKESKKEGIEVVEYLLRMVLTDEDDIEAHLVSIERIMEAYKFPHIY